MQRRYMSDHEAKPTSGGSGHSDSDDEDELRGSMSDGAYDDFANARPYGGDDEDDNGDDEAPRPSFSSSPWAPGGARIGLVRDARGAVAEAAEDGAEGGDLRHKRTSR
eukprot:177897-Chlamydomonas_euryale.AAC.2